MLSLSQHFKHSRSLFICVFVFTRLHWSCNSHERNTIPALTELPFYEEVREGGWWLKTRQNRDFTRGLTPKLVPGFWKMLSTYLGSELYKFICIIICSWKYCSLLTVCFHFMQWSNIFIKIITSKYVSIQISTLRILQDRRIKLHLQPVSGANNNFLRPLELITDHLKTHWPTSLKLADLGLHPEVSKNISLMLTFLPLLFNQLTIPPKTLHTVLIPNSKLKKPRTRYIWWISQKWIN